MCVFQVKSDLFFDYSHDNPHYSMKSPFCQDFCSKLVLPAFKYIGWDQLPSDDDNAKGLRSTVLSAVAKYCYKDHGWREDWCFTPLNGIRMGVQPTWGYLDQKTGG